MRVVLFERVREASESVCECVIGKKKKPLALTF